MKKQVIIQIEQNYQFGQVIQIIDKETVVLNRKILHYNHNQQHDTIWQMINFLKVVRHNSLINIQKVLQAQNEVHIFYQYVPLKLQKWILDVDEQLIYKLQEQLLDLAQFLSRSSIRFLFDSNGVGLTQNMHIKYFLKQFTVDVQYKQQNLFELQTDIKTYFRQLKGTQKIRNQSLSTTTSLSLQGKSLSIGSQDSQKLKKINLSLQISSPRHNNRQLSAKVYTSMMKSLQVLQRFKKMNIK